jgi:hypothetical protein
MGTTPLRLAAPVLLGLCGLRCVAQPIAAQTVEQFYKSRATELLTTAPGNTSPRDGSVLALTQPASWQVAIAGDPNARFDPAKMTWIGSMSSLRAMPTC